MRLLFMGTPLFAVLVLEKLLASGFQVVGVVTRPDQPVGRGLKVKPSPVKELAQAHSLTVFEPPSLRVHAVQEELRGLRPDVIVVAAYGQILPPEVLAIPPHGCINIHPSLLPKWRGASPIAQAILSGERKTGVTIMLMDAGLDTGPILAQRDVGIRDDDTSLSLGERLFGLGAELLASAHDDGPALLLRWVRGEMKPMPQNHAEVTYSPPIKKEDGLIDWRLSAEEIWRRCRAYYPWPSAYTFWRGKLLKILQARPWPSLLPQAEPGQVLLRDSPKGTERALLVATGKGCLVLEQLQLEGKKALDAQAFLVGYRDIVGSVLGR